MFDKFTSSRKEGDGHKMSWHLVLFPDLYYILTIQLALAGFKLN